MATYQPFAGYLTGYTTATQNAMREVWDPVVLDTAFRNSEITRFFAVTNTPWQGRTDSDSQVAREPAAN